MQYIDSCLRATFYVVTFIIFIKFMYFLNTVQSFHIIFYKCFRITWTVTCSKKLHSLKISAESFSVILWLILVDFIYLLRAVKLFLLYSNAYCTITFFHSKSSSPGSHFRVFIDLRDFALIFLIIFFFGMGWGGSGYIFSIFLCFFAYYTVLLVLKNPKYAPDILHRFLVAKEKITVWFSLYLEHFGVI